MTDENPDFPVIARETPLCRVILGPEPQGFARWERSRDDVDDDEEEI